MSANVVAGAIGLVVAVPAPVSAASVVGSSVIAGQANDELGPFPSVVWRCG